MLGSLKCAQCPATVEKLYPDLAKVSDDPCICIDCFEISGEVAIETLQDQITKLNNKIIKAKK